MIKTCTSKQRHTVVWLKTFILTVAPNIKNKSILLNISQKNDYLTCENPLINLYLSELKQNCSS